MPQPVFAGASSGHSAPSQPVPSQRPPPPAALLGFSLCILPLLPFLARFLLQFLQISVAVFNI